MREVDGDGIPQHAEGCVAHAARQQGLEHPGGIAGGATAGVVATVGEDHRVGSSVRTGVGIVERIGQCGFEAGRDRCGQRGLDEVARRAPRRQRHRVRERPRRRPPTRWSPRCARCHREEAVEGRDREHAGLGLGPSQRRYEFPHRPFGRAVEAHQRQPPGLRHWPQPAFQRAPDERHRVARALGVIGVRVLEAADRERGIGEHRRADVGVQVEQDGDRHRRSDAPANGAEQIALHVVAAFGDLRAVHEQEHRVDRHRAFEIGQDLVAERGVVAHVERGARARVREQAGPHRHAGFAAQPHEVAVAERVERRCGVGGGRARPVRLAGEAFGARGNRREGVGLVRHAGHENAKRGHSKLLGDGRGMRPPSNSICRQ